MTDNPSSSTAPSKIGFERDYAISIPGFARLALIAFFFASWVSAAAVLKPSFGTDSLPTNFSSTRSAILFFSIVGDFISIVIYITHVANIVNHSKLSKIPWTILVIISDVIGLIPTVILAIVAAMRENDQKSQNNQSVSNGAFAAASVSHLGRSF